ncbi:MAG TPA: CpsD/CapB family tyrosine-protein kinase [Clostridiales bacterium]|nr:CpsD/CapB family tyrosine-protein kinase [Clostridiales bacterium]
MLQVNLENVHKLSFKSNEAYKQLRTNILFCGKDTKVICLTSCLPNEGKSNVSFHLAMSLAEFGKKVVFIDADLRKSVIVGRYKPDHEVLGLSHYLTGQYSLSDVLYETNIENLDIIFSGPIPPNPAELLGSETFGHLMEMFRKVYDYVIVDTPPLGSVIDSAIAAEQSDGVLLVIEADAISHKFAQKILKQLSKGHCRILGAVLNRYDVVKNPHEYTGKKYKYYYKYYN